MKHVGRVFTIVALALLGNCAHTAASQEKVLNSFGAAPRTPTTTAASKQMVAHNVSIPLSFEANQGQTDRSVRFLSRGSGYSMFLTQDEVVLNLERQQAASPTPGQASAVLPVDTLRMKLVGANPSTAVSATDLLPGVVSYFIGNDPSKWHAGIHTYGRVHYEQVYPGVDLVFYGNQRQLEYDFVVAPGADAGRIAWQIDGARATVDAEGNLVLAAANGPASFKKPVLYQMDGDKRIAVDGSFDVAANKIGFRLGAYDHAKPLIIDPVLSYASYLGGSATDSIGPIIGGYNASQGLALDSEGSVYVTGTTYSTNFPLQNPYQGINNVTSTNSRGSTTFVTKFSPDGTSLVYSTYLGGSGTDVAYAIAVDSNKEAYVTGQTFSSDFPITAGAYEPFCSPAPNVAGHPLVEWSSCAPAGNSSAYVTKLNAAGTALAYSTFLGGDGTQYGVGIAVDAAGRAYVGGISQTECYDGGNPPPPAPYGPGPYPYTCFPTTSGAVVSGIDPDGGDAPVYSFIAVFDPTGADLLYSSLFGSTIFNSGGGGNALATGVNVDSGGNFYLVGYTISPNLPTTAGVIQPTAGPVVDGQMPQDRSFIAKFNPVTATGGATLAYATYLGGQTEFRNDLLNAIVVDGAGNSYVTGFTTSPDFPVTTGSYQTACGASSGACNADFVVKLNSTATAIDWGTYLGDVTGSGDAAQGSGPIALDGNGNVYVAGIAGGANFPQVNPVEPNSNNDSEAFVAEFDPTGTSLLFSTIIYSPGQSEAAGLGVDAAGDIYLAGNINSTGLLVTPGAFQQTFGGGTYGGYGDGYVLKIAPQGTAAVALAASPSTATAGQTVTLTATVTPTATYASVPTGTIEFKDGSTTLNTATLNSSGVGTYTTSTLDPANHNLTAVYSGDNTYPTANGATTLTVYPAGSTTLTSPVPGSTLPGPSATFVWTPGTGATAYDLWLGTTGAGSNNLWGSGQTTATSVTFGGLPTNGETIYARLLVWVSGELQHYDYTFTAASGAVLTAPGSALTGPSATFKWTAPTGSTSYDLWLGTGVGSNNLWSSGSTTATSVTFSGLPTNGEKIYARLFTTLNGSLVHTDATFTAAWLASLSLPLSGSTLNSPSKTFQWSPVTGATGYVLWLGTSGVGSNNLWSLGSTTGTSVPFNRLPTNGEKIYARLFTYFSGGSGYTDTQYNATSQAVLTSSLTFSGTSKTFDWTPANGASDFSIWVGSSVGANDLGFTQGGTTGTTYTVNGLPAETIYVRLWTVYPGGFLAYIDYTVTND